MINLDNSIGYFILINKFKKSENHYFSSIEYFKKQSKSNKDFYFQLIRKKDNFAIASFSFVKKNNIFYSPLNGTFGGPNFTEKNINYKIIEEFLVKCLNILSKQTPKEIQIKLPPMFYDINLISLYINIFLNNGFKISQHEINYQISIDNIDYNHKINSTKKKTLNKSIRSNFFFQELEHDKLEEVYYIIKKNRENKKYKLSMSLGNLKKTLLLFKNKFKLFGVYHNSKLIASAICIILSEKIFYVFYWAEHEDYLKDSPIVFLSSQIYEYCFKNEFKILDVGTASIEGMPNYGLIDYKDSLGYSPSIKFTLKKIY